MARMPYTNFHDINLDWLIKRVMPAYTPDNPPPYPVKSVNGKTGVVQLTGGDIPFSEDFQQATVLDFCDFALEQLENLNTDMASKQDAPVLAGSPGDVLSLDADQNPVWSNPAGGTDDYNDLQNKPQINGVTVSGNKTGTDFGLLNAALARMMYAPIITDTASGDPANFPDGIADMPMNILANIEPVQDLHGYGYAWPDGGNKNLFTSKDINRGYPSNTNFSNTNQRTFTENTYVIGLTNNNYYNTSGVISFEVSDNYLELFTNNGGGAYGISFPITGLEIGSKYTLSCVTTGQLGVSYYQADGTFIAGYQATAGQPYTLTIPADTYYTLLHFRAALYDEPTTFTNIQFEKGSTASSFVPYSNICSISGNAGLTIYTSGADTSDPEINLVAWGDVAGTVYAGTFNAKTGKLKVTHGIVNLGTLNYTKYTSGAQWLFYTDIPDGKLSIGTGNSITLYCSDYKCYSSAIDKSSAVNRDDYSCSWDAAQNQILINDSRYTDKDAFKAAMNGVQLVFELATPIEYTLYSFDINSLYGENNIWTDVGPVSVDYYADTKLYIDKQVAALQALILEI